MSIRRSALKWLSTQHQIHSGPRFASKFYPKSESWTRQNAWAVEIPSVYVSAQGAGSIHLLCQDAPSSATFHYLSVPISFLQSNISGLYELQDGSISLFLSAIPATLFRDERGSAKLNFGIFVVPAPQLIVTSGLLNTAPTETE